MPPPDALSRFDDARRALGRSLAVLGWELRDVEVDVAAGRARVDIARGDRRVSLHVERGRAFFERFRAEERTVPVGRREMTAEALKIAGCGAKVVAA